MKYTYISILCMTLFSAVSFGQKKPLSIPAHNYPQHYFEALGEGIQSNPDTEAIANERPTVSQSTVRGGSPALWEEDFGGGFPTGWAVDDASGICPWKWTTNGSHGNFNGNNATNYAAAISSTTAGNGFLINDPDSANHFTHGQPSGTTYQYLESYFATNAIDLGASYSSLLLEFEQSFRFNNSVDMVVQVSSDSTNWTDFTVQGTTVNNAASTDPDLVSINISAAVGSSQIVYLRIGWSARVYFWMIDDMRIVEGLENDLQLARAYHGDIVLDYQYSKFPLEQAFEMVIGAAVTNLGGATHTNVSIDYDILRNGTSVSSGSFAFPDDIVAAETDTVWHSTGYTPDQTGDYEVVMTVSSDNGDDNLTNQEASSSFEVTDFVFAHDYDESFTIQVWGQATNGTANAYAHGNVFIPYNGGSSVYALEAAFGSNTSTGTSVIAEVHELGASIQDVVDSYETVFDILPSHVNGGSAFFFTTIVLDEAVALNAGTGYTIAIRSEGGADSLWLLSNVRDEDFSTTLYGPYGTGGAVNWYNGWNHTPGLRMNINSDIAGIDGDLATIGFGLYPNPAAESVVVRFNVELGVERIIVLDMSGKLVAELPAATSTNQVTLDVSGLASGIYFVNVLGAKASGVQKLVVQ